MRSRDIEVAKAALNQILDSIEEASESDKDDFYEGVQNIEAALTKPIHKVSLAYVSLNTAIHEVEE